MDIFLRKILKFIKENNLLSAGSKVLVGFSGGADSTALCYSLLTLKSALNIEIEAAHVNYNLRGEDSLADRQYVEHFCDKYGLYLTIKDIQITEEANLEARLRDIRHSFFRETVKSRGLNLIALGHNRNDCAETVLMNVCRGSGLTGLRGITTKSGTIIRPLLCSSREEIEVFLEDSGIVDWRKDRTNYENIFTRNRIRNELIPYIKEYINPNIIDTVYNNALVIELINRYLTKQASYLFEKTVISATQQSISLDLRKLISLDQALIYYVVITAVRKIMGVDYSLTGNSFQAIENLFSAEGSKEIVLFAGLTVRKEYDKLTFTSADENNREDSEQTVTKKSITPGNEQKSLEINGLVISYRLSKVQDVDIKECSKEFVMLDYGKIVPPVYIGCRETGMLFCPLGMKGTKKLKKYFIDEKISKFERDKIPVVSDSEKVLWVVGHRLDSRAAVTPDTVEVLQLKVKPKTQQAQKK